MIECSACRHDNPNGSGFCEGCGAALHDPRKAAREADEIEAEFMFDQVKKGRGALLTVGVLQILACFLTFLMAAPGEGDTVLIATGIIAAVFLGLAWWCGRQPFAAAIVGLVIYAGLHLLGAVADPSTIFQGIIVKVIVIMMLVRAVKAGLAYREFVRSKGLG